MILVVEMKSLLIGESATADQQRAILGAIEETPGVRRLIHMRTLHLGPDELLVAAKVELARVAQRPRGGGHDRRGGGDASAPPCRSPG